MDLGLTLLMITFFGVLFLWLVIQTVRIITHPGRWGHCVEKFWPLAWAAFLLALGLFLLYVPVHFSIKYL